MSDPDQPPWAATVSKSVWKGLLDAQCDVTILMAYLTAASDGRLQAHFDDTRANITNPPAKVATPPCKTYAEFLTRLHDIESALTTSGAREPVRPLPRSPPTDAEHPPLGDISFLSWSRDFLSIVAAPASAASITITQRYVEARLSRTLPRAVVAWFRSVWGMITKTSATHEPTKNGVTSQRTLMAEWIAGLVGMREILAFWLTIVVVLLSTYSISGQLILRSRAEVIAQAKDIAARIESAEKDLYAVASVPQPEAPSGSPANNGRPNGAADTPSQRPLLGPANVIPLCDLIYMTNTKASATDAGVNPYLHRYNTVAQINLCAERQRNVNEGVAIAAQILSWLRWVNGFDAIGLPNIFGDDVRVTADMGKNPFLCYMVTHKPPDRVQSQASANGIEAKANESDQNTCLQFDKILEYYGKEPDSILQCLALYILPSLYGALGAILATLRYVRGRVAASLLTYIDRGRIQQDWLLGLILGAVIGLFADYIGKASPVEGITLSAIALLAGYNVTAVFGLFEDVSNRLFGRSGGATSPAAATG
jgi:hypothetical protein